VICAWHLRQSLDIPVSDTCPAWILDLVRDLDASPPDSRWWSRSVVVTQVALDSGVRRVERAWLRGESSALGPVSREA
jgi:hypothetical protein